MVSSMGKTYGVYGYCGSGKRATSVSVNMAANSSFSEKSF
jgi:hypothetical protein